MEQASQTVSPEVKSAVVQAILSGGSIEVSEALRGKQAEILVLVQNLLANTGLSVEFSPPVAKEEGTGEITAEVVTAESKLSPEVLSACLKGLEADYKRGIVIIDDSNSKTVEDFQAALKADKTAGTPWEKIQERLLANDSALLKKAAGKLQGKGELIGVYPDGELCIKDRGTEPVIFGTTADGKQVTITTDTLNRDEVMQSVRDGGQFANYPEIRAAVHRDGFILPPDSMDYTIKGIVAAVEAITGAPFVGSANDNEWRSAVLECGDVSSGSAVVRVVSFRLGYGRVSVDRGNSAIRFVGRGAVRVIKG